MIDFDLKVDDKVFVVVGDTTRLTRIERETKTLFITKAGGRYNKKNGKQAGSYGYFTPRLEQWTLEKENAFVEKVANNEANKFLASDDVQKRMRALPLDVKQQIIDLLEAHSAN